MAVITPRDFLDSIVSALLPFWAGRTEIAWPNKPFDPEALQEYLQVQVIGDAGGQTLLGFSTLEQTKSRAGTVSLSVFVKQNTSLDRAYDLADAALEFLEDFRTLPETILNGIGITEIGPDGVFYQIDVAGSYLYFTDRP